jgi:hypothetical protein
MPPLLRATARPPRSLCPTLARGLLYASDTSAPVVSSLAARLSAARCFLDLKPHAILAFVVFVLVVVLPVTRHADKYCNNGDTHHAYRAPSATSIATTRAHMALTACARPLVCVVGFVGRLEVTKAAFGVLQWTHSLKCLKNTRKLRCGVLCEYKQLDEKSPIESRN